MTLAEKKVRLLKLLAKFVTENPNLKIPYSKRKMWENLTDSKARTYIYK